MENELYNYFQSRINDVIEELTDIKSTSDYSGYSQDVMINKLSGRLQELEAFTQTQIYHKGFNDLEKSESLKMLEEAFKRVSNYLY